MYQPYEEVENEDDVSGREDPPRVVVNLLDALQRVPFHGESFNLFLKSQIKRDRPTSLISPPPLPGPTIKIGSILERNKFCGEPSYLLSYLSRGQGGL